jgi:hypothetical protein
MPDAFMERVGPITDDTIRTLTESYLDTSGRSNFANCGSSIVLRRFRPLTGITGLSPADRHKGETRHIPELASHRGDRLERNGS